MKSILILLALLALALLVPMAFAEGNSVASAASSRAISGPQAAKLNGTDSASTARYIAAHPAQLNVGLNANGTLSGAPAAAPDCSSLRENIVAKDKEIAALRARVSDLEAKLGVGAHNNSNPGAEARIPPNGTSLRIDPHKIPGITPSSIADLPAGQVNAVLPSIANPNAVARQPPNGTLVRTEPYNATGRTPTTSAVKTAEWASAIKEYFLNTSNQKKASPGGANSGGSTASVANAMVGTDSEDYARIMNVLGIYVKN